MGLQHAYSATNLLSTLAVGGFTWSDASGNVANRSYLIDQLFYKQLTLASLATTVNVIIDLGAAQTVSFAAILNHNLRLAGGAPTLKVDSADSADFLTNPVANKAASALYRSTNLDSPRDRDHAVQFIALSKRYWKLTFTWTGNFALSLGELWLGNATTLSRYSIFSGRGDSEQFKINSVEAASGEVRSHVLSGPIRSKTVQFDDLSSSERDEIMSMWRAGAAGGKQLLFLDQYESSALAAPTDYQDVILGFLQQRELGWREFDYLRYGNLPELTIRSLGREVGA